MSDRKYPERPITDSCNKPTAKHSGYDKNSVDKPPARITPPPSKNQKK